MRKWAAVVLGGLLSTVGAWAADAQPPTIITNPDWLHKPTSAEMARAWPLAATQRRIAEGRAIMKCMVTVQGLLDRCVILSESPAGADFGLSALLVAPAMLFKPKMVNGKPVGDGEVTIPMHFIFPGDPSKSLPTNDASYQILEPIWLKAPVANELAAAFPRAAIGKTSRGHVVLRCGFDRQGNLKECKTLEEQPKSMGFANAARGLSRAFQANIAPFADKAADSYVDLPFHFIDPVSEEWRNRTLAQPHWTAGPSKDDVEMAFPAPARNASVWSGLGSINCLVTAGGKLDGCHVVNEQPASLGFGAAALKLAPTFAMNAWTVEGMPADGVRIQLPIRLVTGPPTPATKP